MYRIIEQEKELRSRKAESSLWSEATGDSKVKPKKHWSDKQKASHQKIATTHKIMLQVSLANSKAVFDLRVKPSKSALDQSSFPWQVKITLIMMADDIDFTEDIDYDDDDTGESDESFQHCL